MAQPALRLETNVPGDFYVDSTCIDCDACRIFAPAVFRDDGGMSSVYRQPRTEEERLAAHKALVSCPTSSIGAESSSRVALDALPEVVEGDVERCGYTSESSFGAISYFLRGPEILVDSPRFVAPLVKRLGNVRRMLLTHQDDIADHAKYHERFGCERVLHLDDARGRVFESMPRGSDPLDLGDDVLLIPTPGHTRGHVVFLYCNKYLFTGDHLAWSETRGHLYAFRSACWYSWSEQIRSMERLLDYDFEWVLPGHGRPVRLPPREMRASLERCVAWMKTK